MTVYVLPLRSPKLDGYTEINVTTHGDDPWRQLSPMLLGPTKPNRWGHTFRNVENAWQYSKVYPTHLDSRNNPTDEYWKWLSNGMSSNWAERYPMGKGAIPAFTLYNGVRMDYLTARRNLYAPLYADAVLTYQSKLLSWLKFAAEFTGLVIRDFDAYNHHGLGYSWDDVINDPERKMGHGFVLAMMIEGYI